MVACLLLAGCAPALAAPASEPTLPPDWSVREVAGLRIAAPSAWRGPEVLPGRDAAGPREWIVFRDTSGEEALTLLTWRGANAASLAASQYEGERPRGQAPQALTFADGSSARTGVALTAFASWYDMSGSGSYECRHVFVQVDPSLVVDVVACGAHGRGSSTPAPDVLRIQDRVVARLSSAPSR